MLEVPFTRITELMSFLNPGPSVDQESLLCTWVLKLSLWISFIPGPLNVSTDSLDT